MRTLILSLLAFALFAPTADAQRLRLGDPDPYASDYAKIREKLKSQKITFDFQESPLQDVIEFLRSVLNINILLDPEVAREKDPDELKVTLAVKDLRADNALGLLLEFKNLTPAYRQGVLVITTEERHSEAVFLAVYDVRDLMFTVKDFPGPDIGLASGGGAGPGVTFEEDDTEENELANPETLIEVIQGNAAGSSWEDNDKCTCSIINGLMVVNQTRTGHQEVGRLLNMLRGFR